MGDDTTLTPSPLPPSVNTALQAALDDSRLTLIGLYHESWSGLEGHLERRLREVSDLSLQWFVLLIRLARSPNHRLRLTDLAGQTGLSPSGLTRALDRLEEAGLARRQACPDDRRSTWATITQEGVDTLQPALTSHLKDLDEAFLRVLEPDEQDELARLLRKVRDHINPDAGLPPAPITS